MTEIKFRLTDVGESRVTSGSVAVRVAEAVRGWVWLMIPTGTSETLAKALVDAERGQEGPTDEAPGTAAVRAAADLVLRSEFTNWQDLSGPKSRALTKVQRTRLEVRLAAYRESLELVMEAEGVPGPLEDFLEELSGWKVNHSHSKWVYERSLYGYRR
ncbi:hypothetical protein ACIP6P_00655 [Streptomyces sp. NPDC088729]|uniref:hypothetical protein n=1 Tax=Streptomyces sp. NPDC088729 TaxID=3365876 RepID=UPI0037F3DDFD